MPPRAIRRSPIRWRDSAASTCWPTAGRGVAGACEEFSLEQLREQMELNFFAAAEMTRAVLPQMRRGSGNVITVSSIAGLVAMNAAGPYCAAKFALEGWTESLAIEAGPLGIHVTGRARRLPHRIRRRREHAADAAHRGLPPIDCTV